MANGIGENVKFYRLRANLTQKELAEKLGYSSQSALTKIEKNQRDIPLSMVSKIAKVLGIPVSSLFAEHKEQALISEKSAEFIPYIEDAEDWQLNAVRKILDMPNPKKDSVYMKMGS